MGYRNRDGSRAAQHNRARQLSMIANQLNDLGYHHLQVTSLKTKHVEALVKHWQEQGLSNGTRTLRWWAGKIDRPYLIAKDNSHYSIGRRTFVTNVSKAKKLIQSDLEKIKDVFVRLSLELLRLFGLRREKSLKSQPSYADRGDHILLKSCWTKGGKEPSIPVCNANCLIGCVKPRKAGR